MVSLSRVAPNTSEQRSRSGLCEGVIRREATETEGLVYRVIEYADSEYDTKEIVMYLFVFFCLHVTKSKQISKIIVATCSLGLYGVIEYADSEYDTKKASYVYIFCFYVTKSKQISKIIVATCSQGLYRVFIVFPYYIVF